MLVYAYIDESGDPGIAGGTKWLLVACAVIDADRKERIEDMLFALSMKVSGGRPLHFTGMSHDNKKGCYQHIVGQRWWGVVAIADTKALFPKRLRDPKILYFDVLREIVRRVLWRAEEFGETPDIVIDERHRRFDLNSFKRYLAAMNRDDDPQTNWGILDSERITTAEPADEPCLSIPDGLAHAVHKMLEPNEFAGPERTYFAECLPKLWVGKGERDDPHRFGHRRGKLLGNGVVLLPESDVGRFLREGFGWALN